MASTADPITCRPTPGFVEWLASSGGSLMASTYQAGALALIGWNGRQVTLLLRRFDKPMGLDIRQGRVALATRTGVLILQDDQTLARTYDPGRPGRYDALFLPRLVYHTNDLNIHDIALQATGLCFANTRLSCLACPSETYNFEPVWTPPFIDELAPEDRCHLNGLALRDDRPAFVTALGETNRAGGWRENRSTGGIVVDVDNDRVIRSGLAMPHSPRWHEGQLWVLNSGEGQLHRLDHHTGQSEIVCHLPGYLRGLAFTGNHALIGMSRIREQRIFGGMPVAEGHDRLLCGIAVVELKSGRCEGILEFVSGCTELFDVRFLEGRRQPNLLNPQKEQAYQAVSAPGLHYWLRPEDLLRDDEQAAPKA